MDLSSALSRARRGFRDDLRLHVVAVISLVVAFLCLGAALLSVENLSRVAERWSGAQHLTVYLKDNAAPGDVAQLRLVLESLQETASVRLISAEEARREFAAQVDLGTQASALPADAFPASLEVALKDRTSDQRVAEVAERVQRFGAVDEVETYRDWLTQMGTLLRAGKSAVGLLAVLVMICVLAIIGNTIRVAVTSRRREIEVLKLCGATDGFVRSPFLLEGVMQASAAAMTALVLLLIAYLAMRGQVEATLGAVTGIRTVFLDPITMAAMVVGGGMMGALGSALSLRRYLKV
ncbi:MAG TPA: permease-like cell division protein FtsX [Polyangiales bacterium]|nr:permease-like cell division protein FtsX [Polyangiales bacterium]